ncbi:unnamed protein product [Protopolystoma xenopodis]|uniref:Protein kinase domain-containing protein n=1 Tax=Protopolystoma xenopodis TaxID=117903 RepID=A0A3S5FC89_9PLAT|nr:unnamed protein product [Protopolystoma xenopodis]
MAYLEQRGLIHRDLAARNILLTHRTSSGFPTAKVADFGMARDLQLSGPVSCPPLQTTSMSPACLPNQTAPSSSLNTSFGVGSKMDTDRRQDGTTENLAGGSVSGRPVQHQLNPFIFEPSSIIKSSKTSVSASTTLSSAPSQPCRRAASTASGLQRPLKPPAPQPPITATCRSVGHSTDGQTFEARTAGTGTAHEPVVDTNCSVTRIGSLSLSVSAATDAGRIPVKWTAPEAVRYHVGQRIYFSSIAV